MARGASIRVRSSNGDEGFVTVLEGLLRRALSREGPRWPLRATYLVFVVALLAYVVSVVARAGQADSSALDGWAIDGFEVAASGACIAAAFWTKSIRPVALLLGLGILSWSCGDTIVTAVGGSGQSTPTAADVCYLAFYPLAYAGIVIRMRSEVKRLAAPSWLDGGIAGLGAAAVCAAFAFHSVLLNGPNALANAMNLAYPVGDVLLFALVIGGTAVVSGAARAPWIMLAVACSLNAVGDTFNLLHSSLGASQVGQVFNAVAWPIAIVLISMSVWIKAESPDTSGAESQAGFLLPGLASGAALVILTINSVASLGRVAFALATATLGIVGVRLILSVGTLRSITRQRHKESVTDELTGLGNRRYLAELFEAHIAGTAPGPLEVACLFVDLDRFKEVNDAFGHAAGDELLRQIGPRLSSSLRRSDLLVRLGGDEFAVLLPETDATHAAEIAGRLLHSIELPFYLEELPIEISASVGIAVAPIHAKEMNDLLRCADAAMYRAKLSAGRVEIYDPGADEAGGDVLRLVEDLRSALRTGDQLELHYQPQLELRTGRIVAVEALLRWAHPRLGTIPPLRFIGLAEDAGLMPALTEHVLNKAVAQCARWGAEGNEIIVSVNVSSSNLLDQGFVDLVESVLERHGLPAERLVLEVTETCMITDYERSRHVIDRLRRLGVVTSIDDFGAGFTSLAYLGDLPVGELKLDRSFVAALAEDGRERDRELVRSTISLGHALGLRVVAEGIEDTPTLELLGGFGCDLIQGYIVSRPRAAADLSFDTAYARS